MVVGFNSTTYTGTETAGHARVCVEVLNPSSGGAVRPFSITMFPEEGNSFNGGVLNGVFTLYVLQYTIIFDVLSFRK